MKHDVDLRAVLRELLAGQRATVDELRGLRVTLTAAIERAGQRRQDSPLSRADRAALDVLVPQIRDTVGVGVVFAVADLIAQSDKHHALGAAITSIFGECGPGTPRRIGKLLARSSGVVLEDGLRIERSGSAREGVLWRLESTYGGFAVTSEF